MAQFPYTDGYIPEQLASNLPCVKSNISKAADYTLTDAEKDTVLAVEFTAASKTLTLALTDKQAMFIVNIGATNAVTLKNKAADSGVSLAAGKIALCFAESGALKAYVLN